ncbi:hypothetical protein GCM10023175_53210 [Pseudonocardia xishanensis]|uniref:Thiolase N-terminal domain-containing protein n=1 Tax=Pseudonocardia xishanensis TaxID=630995 RepID=A0ABP8RZJ5_9PSEU
MLEAVIVAVVRPPIGRARKGSLKDMRPDDLTTQMVQDALDQVPELDPTQIEGCGPPGGESGNEFGRMVSVLLGLNTVPGPTITRYCSSSVQTTRMAMHAIRAGEGDAFVSAGGETGSRFEKGNSDSLPETRNPLFDKAQEHTRATAESDTGPRAHGPSYVYIAMGQTAEDLARLTGVTREDMDRFGVRSQNLARLPPRRPDHRRQLLPAQRRRRGPDRHVRHQGSRPGPHAGRPGGRHRPVAGDHGLRPGRGAEAGPRPHRHDCRRRRPLQAQ